MANWAARCTRETRTKFTKAGFKLTEDRWLEKIWQMGLTVQREPQFLAVANLLPMTLRRRLGTGAGNALEAVGQH